MNMSTTTIHKYLEGQFYSVKKVLPQPSAMNSAENKEKKIKLCRQCHGVNWTWKTDCVHR